MAGLQTYLAFAETVRHGSFAEAARRLGLSASAVAKSVARLEEDLGVRLFQRTTRQVSLTIEGQTLYERVCRIADEIEALHDEASGARAEPTGTLRLNAPVVLGRMLILPALAALRRRHPALAMEVELSDRQVDIVGERVDAALRIGPLADSTLSARRIGQHQIVVIAAPHYLEQHGQPATPADLAGHACLRFRMPSSGRVRPWDFIVDGSLLELNPPSAVTINDGEALVAAVAEGVGLAQVPDYMTTRAIEAGRVVEVLAAFRPPPLPISLVYPSARRITPRLRALMEALAPGER
ncbi:LysR family transcriptional regulator [Azoarcus sp. DD4]|uniref:LysR family transcriptional regulator n=1 Tax=Azoarcus sp. DD4 TaxID=2027405 RepID=UPI00112D4344|nr:LysR family transcriptional regulator [Azoarcus sp. DD4]QDF97670.1 LysR family transcriptional regulator [Azoarcus sp. DD4]